MNLFISDNFIDTLDKKINIVQLIQQVAEDDDLLQVEILGELADMFDYSTASDIEEAINDGDFEDLAIRDDILYVGGETLRDLFESLFPGDHTVVINALVSSIENATDSTLRLDHNGTPVVQELMTADQVNAAAVAPWLEAGAPSLSNSMVGDVRLGEEVQQDITEPVPEGNVVTAVEGNTLTRRPVEVAPFSPAEEVQRSEVAVLNSEAILGELKINGRTVPVRQVTGKNGVLFSVDGLYSATYNLQHDPDYLRQILVEYRSSIDPEDILFSNGGIYLTVYGLAKLHGRLCHIIEWQPLVAKIVNQFTLNPYESVSFDLLGNQVG